MDCSLPGSSDHGILQARILEWVAILSSMGIFLTQGSNPGFLHYRQLLPSEPPGRAVLLLFSGSPSRSLNLSSGLYFHPTQTTFHLQKKILHVFQSASHPSNRQTLQKVKKPGILSQHELIPPLTPAPSFQSPGVQLCSRIGTPPSQKERGAVSRASCTLVYDTGISRSFMYSVAKEFQRTNYMPGIRTAVPACKELKVYWER